MPFVKVPGLTGKLYVPEKQHPAFKKHQCTDCYSCGLCSDDRCRLCLNKKKQGCGGCCGTERHQKTSS